MKFAYADPPYFGSAVKHYGERARIYDTVRGHQELLERLAGYDGWALSMSSKNLLNLVPHLDIPPTARVGSWCKPFVFFRPGMSTAYGWEPVLFVPLRTKAAETTMDWCAANTTFGRGLAGAKPLDFCLWLLRAVGAERNDEFEDIFPGTRSFSAAVELFRQSLPLRGVQLRRGRRYRRQRAAEPALGLDSPPLAR